MGLIAVGNQLKVCDGIWSVGVLGAWFLVLS
jgi:hypothetical protein